MEKNVTILCLHYTGECMAKLRALLRILTGQGTHQNQGPDPFTPAFPPLWVHLLKFYVTK